MSTDVNVLTSESLTDNDILAEFQDEDCNNKSDDEPDGEKTAVKLLTPFSDSAFLLTENSRQFSSFILTIFIFRINSVCCFWVVMHIHVFQFGN